MTVYGIAHTGLCVEATITTHPHAEAARQYLAANAGELATVVVSCPEDLALSGPTLVNLHNLLVPEKRTKKFSTKQDAQRRVFAALEQKFSQQQHEPFEPVETTDGEKDTNPVVNSNSDTSSDQPKEGQMAKTKKTKKKTAVKKTAGDRKPRAAAPLFEELAGNSPKANMTCGLFIRSMLMKGKDTATILDAVKKHYPDSSAKASDVSWNKGKLKAAGKKVPTAD